MINHIPMKFLKQDWPVLSIFLLVVCLVLIRTFNRENFRYDAVRWAESSIPGSNLVTEDTIRQMDGEVLLINLGKLSQSDIKTKVNTVNLDPGLILEKENLTLIRKNKGPVILLSDDSSVSARVWLVLSEMGMKNIYILNNYRNSLPEN
ncbi:MAG TPA: rhodanese-like domain-containing protein [Bacteroidales bacterium]|nr:rhodanese-like domain-containing protein [Bacteroidales bacterium]